LVDISKKIKKDSIDLIENEGFYEYFDPLNKSDKIKKRACGSNNFSWSAALYIDFYNR
ncbi:MAG: glycoside hydrolase, partial [Flavobacteriaceae bacterium]|nr:glycoside hydrolase [Flavobacteriaceae bacterium]